MISGIASFLSLFSPQKILSLFLPYILKDHIIQNKKQTNSAKVKAFKILPESTLNAYMTFGKLTFLIILICSTTNCFLFIFYMSFNKIISFFKKIGTVFYVVSGTFENRIFFSLFPFLGIYLLDLHFYLTILSSS